MSAEQDVACNVSHAASANATPEVLLLKAFGHPSAHYKGQIYGGKLKQHVQLPRISSMQHQAVSLADPADLVMACPRLPSISYSLGQYASMPTSLSSCCQPWPPF